MYAITVLDYLDQDALMHPDHTAVIENEKRISYRELCLRAMNFGNALAGALEQKTGNAAGDRLPRKRLPVVLFMDKGIDTLTAMYGTLYSGNFYVPMDVKTPADRLKSILTTLGEYQVVTSSAYEKDLQNAGYEGKYLLYENLAGRERSEADNERLKDIRRSIIDTDLMYLIFTSGSTGTPKGVATQHRALMDYAAAFLYDIGMSSDDVCGNQAPFYADMSCREIFACLASGATLCIIPQKLFLFPKNLLQYLEDNCVTFIAWVPTAYRIVMQFHGLEKVRPSCLKRLLFSGESMPVPVYRYWKHHYPKAEFLQSYGPTEITGSCTYYYVKGEYADDAVIPIGKPFLNTGILLLDEDDRIIEEPGKAGEICVYGTCLAAGYYHNEEKTRETFTDLPASVGYGQKMYRTGDLASWDDEGNLVFHSRKDYQVKHMGKRIELGEIETAVCAVKEIDGCCCVHNRQKDALVLYYIGGLSEKDLIGALRSKLPPYMIPGKLFRMDSLPQLPNGKTDRKRLDQMANEL